MLRAFAASATAGRKWYPLWALNFDGSPFKLDYAGDHSFVREVPAVFELVEQCLRFELKFESAGQFDGFEGEGAIQSRVTSSIPLRFTFASVRIEGQAPLVNENFSIIMTDDYFNVCQIENRRGGGEAFLQVFNLMDRFNGGPIEGRATSRNFGEPIGQIGPPRTLEFGFKLDF